MNYLFTVFTPVYNGAETFHRVFESLQNQTYKNFEWIIVNDGSTDNSDELINQCTSSVNWDIKYLKQENMGKHIAWNKALEYAKGDLFVPADCDDSFSPSALSFFNEKWSQISDYEKSKFSGINVLCIDPVSTKIIGDKFPFDNLKTNNLELDYKYKLQGEKWGCIRVDLLKQLPFPIYKNNFYPESYLWFSLSKKYSVLCFNMPLRHYYINIRGISQSRIWNKPTKEYLLVSLHYQYWFLKNFTIYVMRYSPKAILRTIASICKSCIQLVLVKCY